MLQVGARAEGDLVQVWMTPHPPKRGIYLLGSRPQVHTGFHKAWTANGLHTEIMQYLQVQRHLPCTLWLLHSL